MPDGQLTKFFDGGTWPACRHDQRAMLSASPVAFALPATIFSPGGVGWVAPGLFTPSPR